MPSKPQPALSALSAAPAPAMAPKRRGRPAKSENDSLRGELIKKSAFLFRTQGYDNTTVRDIAAAAGIHSGSWFYHFKTKQDILAAVMEQGMTQSLADIEAIALHTLAPRDALRRLVEVHLQTLLAPNHDFIPVLLYEWRSLDPLSRARIIKLKDRYEAIWDGVLKALHASGEWAMPTRFDRLLMFGALNWTAQWYKPGGAIALRDLADSAVTFILRSPPRPA
ncbi:TetR/AcrR family transcriptional regulator [Pseudoduganella namucuonensis]|uniref:Transcriptional regulator, TetR family n=1 Tax=Pseudoduganella namucuonensis TaxID=1035707 RepID=A0A1I7KVQ0_9BURK|nr:transcriptional regulator, TetR family [Pseudoduganella namucuonensis]